MIREEEIKHVSKDYVNYLLDKQEYHNEKYTEYDIKQAFKKGVEWADKNSNSRTIAEYLYKEKGYPISLNGDIPTYEEVVKHVQAYNNHKKACDDIESTDTESNLEILWHDASEEPQDNYIVLCDGLDNLQWVENCQHIDIYYANWQNYAKAFKVNRWAYIKDLLPKGGKK